MPTAKPDVYQELISLSAAHMVRFLNWFEVVFGWLGSLLFGAIVSGMTKRSDVDH